jgi:hypothetical protein
LKSRFRGIRESRAMERFKLATLGIGHYLSNEKNIIAEADAVGETSQDA